jgi:hypothetical protein
MESVTSAGRPQPKSESYSGNFAQLVTLTAVPNGGARATKWGMKAADLSLQQSKEVQSSSEERLKPSILCSGSTALLEPLPHLSRRSVNSSYHLNAFESTSNERALAEQCGRV